MKSLRLTEFPPGVAKQPRVRSDTVIGSEHRDASSNLLRSSTGARGKRGRSFVRFGTSFAVEQRRILAKDLDQVWRLRRQAFYTPEDRRPIFDSVAVPERIHGVFVDGVFLGRRRDDADHNGRRALNQTNGRDDRGQRDQ